ncbi:hypothetical protein QBC38DRAFT_454869 [Podospora fimiseda]|uniref:Uncharacterized protein n=1 Tax=Podospora fimiseda TaxID=252190 RepID=A0AAN7BRT3_9PEZI|nr:hypothetical protein QBC38DRAFT_454869 [Podospora fimiseda]
MSGNSTTKEVHGDPRLRSVLETKGVKFHITAGGQKWHCTILDRQTHERRKAMHTDSSSSVSTEDSNTTRSSASSAIGSH